MSETTASRSASAGRAAVLILVAILVGLGVRLLAQPHYQRFGSDSFHYLLLARSLASGDGFVSGGSQHPDLSRPPLFPLLIAATWTVTGDSDTVALVLVALWSALLVIPLFYMARGMFGPQAGLASLPLGALSCLLVSGLHLYPTALYTLLFVSAAAATWSASLRPKHLLIFSAGLLAGLAALARPEGLFLSPVLAAWLGLSRTYPPPRPRADHHHPRPRVGVGGALLLLAGSLLVYVPYAIWTSARLGRWAPCPPIQYVTDMREVADALGLREIEEPGVSWEELARFTLTSDHKDFVLDTYFEKGVLALSNTGYDATDAVSGTARSWSRVMRRLVIVRSNLLDLAKTLYGSHFLPLAPVALAGVGLLAGWGHDPGRRGILFLTLMAITALVPVVSHVEPRFLFVPFSFGLVASAGGWGYLADRLSAPTVRRRWMGPLLHCLVLIAVSVSGVMHSYVTIDATATEHSQREVAAVASRQLGDGAMLARVPYIPYWAEKPYRALPLGTPSDVLDYARFNGATSLVIAGDRDLERRPQLAPLMVDPLPDGFRLILSRPWPEGGELRLFELGRSDVPKVPFSAATDPPGLEVSSGCLGMTCSLDSEPASHPV